MKIALLGNYPTYCFANELGIKETVIHRITSWNHTLASGLCNLPDVEVYFITKGSFVPKTQTVNEKNLTVTYLVAPKILNALTMYHNLKWMAHDILKSIKPDIVHGIGTEHIWPYAAATSGFPYVITVHGIVSQIIRKVRTPIFTRLRYFGYLEKSVLAKTKYLISISPYVEQALGCYTQAKIYPVENPVATIFHGITSTPHARRKILFVGDTTERKNLGALLMAFAELSKASGAKDWEIDVVGPVKKGDYYVNTINPIILENDLANKVNFKGFLLPGQLAKEYRDTAFLVLCSIEETAPMCIAEAMSAGLPVIASRISGVPYMVKEDKSGFLFQSKNYHELVEKMKILMVNPELRYEMGVVGKRIAQERWKPCVIARKTHDVYLKVLNKSNNE